MKKQRAELLGQALSPKVRHYSGMPPLSSDQQDQRMQMRWPAYLIIEERLDGIFLLRFDKQGNCVGDTWHKSEEEAKEQADFEYGELLSDWEGCDE